MHSTGIIECTPPALLIECTPLALFTCFLRVVQVANETGGNGGAEQLFGLRRVRESEIGDGWRRMRKGSTLRCLSAWRAVLDLADFFFPGMIRRVLCFVCVVGRAQKVLNADWAALDTA